MTWRLEVHQMIRALINVRQSCGLESTWSPSNTRVQRGVVDHVSDIGLSRLNRALGIVWRYLAPSRDANEDWTDKNSRDLGSLPTWIARLWPSDLLHRIGRSVNFVIKFPIKIVLFLCKLNFWLNPEEIKRLWSKILSSSWSPCVLEPIAIILKQDWSQIVARIDRNLPLNVERMPEKKLSKYTLIDVIWSVIFTSIRLVVWFECIPCNLCSLDSI